MLQKVAQSINCLSLSACFKRKKERPPPPAAVVNVKVISSFSCESWLPAWLCPGARVNNLIIKHQPGTLHVPGFLKPSPLLVLIHSFCPVFSCRGGDQQHEEWAGEVWHSDARLQQDWRDPGEWAFCGRSCMWERGSDVLENGGGVW